MCTSLVALLTTTRILSRFLEGLGMSIRKAMEISLYFDSGIWVDSNLPFDSVWSDFSIWHTGQFSTKLRMSPVIPFQKNDRLALPKVLYLPGCALCGIESSSCMILSFVLHHWEQLSFKNPILHLGDANVLPKFHSFFCRHHQF